MGNFVLESSIRNETRKGNARKLRATGRVPAVVYGQKESALGVSVDEAALRGVLGSRSDSAVIDLVVKGAGDPISVIIRDIQRHPATGRVLHVDFQRIRLGEKIRVEIAVSVVGTPTGVKEQGGVLEHGSRSVNVMCLPSNIPSSIEVDASSLSIGESISLGAIAGLYPDLDILDDADVTLATVIPPTVEAATATEAGEGEAEAAGEEDAELDESKDADSGKTE